MFNSCKRFSKEGFTVYEKGRKNGVMVASHPSLSNFLVKKYENKFSHEDQLKNFLCRINGARILNDFIKLNNFKHITVAQKWLYPLPEAFSDSQTGERAYVLIVEKLPIRSGGDHSQENIARMYAAINKETLKELCTVLYYFRGLDSDWDNLPFTYQNQIAFVDTENWEDDRQEYLLKLKVFLSEENQKYAEEIFEDLRRQS